MDNWTKLDDVYIDDVTLWIFGWWKMVGIWLMLEGGYLDDEMVNIWMM
jgi:hypothetical protein